MKVAKYLSSLLPSFDRSQVTEDLRLLKEELNDSTLPPFQQAAETFGRDGFRARSVKDFDSLFLRQTRAAALRSSDWVQMTHQALSRADEVLDLLSGKINKEFAKDINAEGMTYLRANILRYLETVSFAVRYARKTLLWALAEEQNAITNRNDSPIAKAEKSWLIANRDVFFRAIVIMSTPVKEADRFFKNIPNMVVIPEEVEAVEQTVGVKRLDPFSFGLMPPKLNPIYHVRMAIAEWQVSRYKATQEEAKALEYRLLALRELQEGAGGDAKLEQQIEYTEGRLQKLNYKLAEMVEE